MSDFFHWISGGDVGLFYGRRLIRCRPVLVGELDK